jgi:Domain of unknown function (DUF4114)
MADIIFGTPINGSIADADPKLANVRNPLNNSSFDEYDIAGITDFNQVEITVTPDAVLGAGIGAIQLVNAATGAVLAQNSFSGITSRTVIGTSFPGIKYKVQVVGAGVGTYKLEMTDAGKATSIVTPLTAKNSGNPFSKVSVGTVGPNTELYPLASSTLTDNVRLLDVALDANKKLYGIGPNTQGQDTLFSIDPGVAASFADAGVETSEQIKSIGTVKNSATAILSDTLNALEFGADNKLYALGKNSRKLYTIDPATAIATAIAGDLPTDFSSSGDLVYDAAGNRFLATSKPSTGLDELWSIPIAAPGNATKIGTSNIGFAEVTGLSFEGSDLTGFTSGDPAAVGSRIDIDLTTGVGRLQDKIGDNDLPLLTNGISGASTITRGTPVVTNLAPTGINFTNALTSIGSTTSTAAAVKVADLSAIDDGLGTNVFSLAGTDAASFEITGTSLFLRAGTVLNIATKPSFSVNVDVNDATVGTITPDATKIFTLPVVAPVILPAPPTGTPGTKGQSATQRAIDLTDYAGTLKADVTTNGDAAYTNNIGFYVVQDAIGTIRLANGTTIAPGAANYALEAVKSALLLAGKNDSKLNQDINGRNIYAPVVVAQGSLAEFVSNNPTNIGDGTKIHAYFNYLGANPDNFDHFKLTGANTFAVEDQFGGGDKDFNDLVVKMNIKTA